MSMPVKSKPKVTFDEAAFKTAVKKITVDDKFRAQLEQKPVATLEILGFKFADDVVKDFANKPLSEAIQLGSYKPVEWAKVLVNIRSYARVNILVRIGVGVQVRPDIIQHSPEMIKDPATLVEGRLNQVIEPIDMVAVEKAAKQIKAEINSINTSL
jgi:hypothetical protein